MKIFRGGHHGYPEGRSGDPARLNSDMTVEGKHSGHPGERGRSAQGLLPKSHGNDLLTPVPEFGFPGLKAW